MSHYIDLTRHPYLVADCETTGLDWSRDRLIGVALRGSESDRGYYFDWQADRSYIQDQLEGAQALVNHNIKFDWHFWTQAGIRIAAPMHCTMVAAALHNEHEHSYALDALCQKYFMQGKVEVWDELAKLFGGKPTKEVQMPNLARAPHALIERYAVQDVALANTLWKFMNQRLHEQDLARVYQVEMRLLRALCQMERRGVHIDVPRAEQAVVDLRVQMRREQAALDELAGKPINVNSNKQLAAVLVKERVDERTYLLHNGQTVPATDGGAPSLRADVLRHVHHPVARSVETIRKLDKTVNTFLLGHILGSHRSGVVHANFNQTKSDNDLGTGTGRLSVNSPALQQIHKRDKTIASVVRACFLPDPKQAWLALDWSQMDFRMFAHYVNSPQIIEAYAADPDLDYHSVVAEIAGIPRDRDPTTGGGNAKQINLGMVFGMGAGRLAMEMGLSYNEVARPGGKPFLEPGPEARELVDKYHRAIPGVRDLLATASALAKRRGYVMTALGRRIRFPQGFYHKAAGLVFQGSAADCLKVKLCELHEGLQGTPASLMLNVHDEFDITVPPGNESLVADIRATIERFDGDVTPLKFRVPIRSDEGAGANWWDASKKGAPSYKEYTR